MKKIAYVRVSSIDQNIARQKEAIENHVEIDKWYIEKTSGKDRNRPKLNQMLDYVREDDIIYIHSLDRLARNTKDLLNIVEQLSKEKVHLHSLKDNFVFDDTPTGKFILTILAGFAEFERAIAKERQLEGIAIAKENNVYKGRKPIKINKKQFEELYIDYKKGYITQEGITRRLNISRTTLYRRIKEYEKLEEQKELEIAKS